LLLCWCGTSLAATDEPAWPRVLACDAVEGIVVIEHRGMEQALLRGQTDQSGDWRITQVTADSAVLESTGGKGMRIRAYLAGSGRSPVKFEEQAPPSAPARSLVIVPARVRSDAQEKQ
jgi:type II secretory pathway component PulC